MRDWSRVIGSRPDNFSDAFYEARPGWVEGSEISHHDARFLFRQALEAGAEVAVEIGTASGFSTALLCHALNFARAAGLVSPDFRVVTYGSDPVFYLDHNRRTGDAARELLPSELLEHVTFHAPATAADVRRHFGHDAIEFLFIDASHPHPWPTLDLLATLDCLRGGAVVVLHDINLPLVHPEFPEWGVKHLFDNLDGWKRLGPGDPVPNVGSITISKNKEELRGRLLKILFDYRWQADDVSEEVATLALT